MPLAETHRHSAAEVNELLEKTGTTVYGLQLINGAYRTPWLTFTPTVRRRRSGGTLEKFVERTGGAIVIGEKKEKKDLAGWKWGTGPIVARLGEADELLLDKYHNSVIYTAWSHGYLPELINLVLNGAINPGKVFDLTLPLTSVADGYRAMDERRAIKTLLRP